MTVARLEVSVQETGKQQSGWKQWLVRYGGALPDSIVWVPENLDPEMWVDFMRDLADES